MLDVKVILFDLSDPLNKDWKLKNVFKGYFLVEYISVPLLAELSCSRCVSCQPQELVELLVW